GLTTLSSGTFQVLPTLPIITSFLPATGPPGTSVTIRGRNFRNPTQVTFGGAASGFVVYGDTLIIATVPANAATGLINVTAGNVGSSQGSFIVTPLITSITDFLPVAGYTGSTVLIRGQHFTGLTIVRFNGAVAPFNRLSDTVISATVPANATSGVISVVVGTQTALSPSSFTVLTAAPEVLSLTPATGPEGTAFLIRGHHFIGTTGVQLNGVNISFSLVSDSVLSASVPVGALTGFVVVINPYGNAASPSPFTVTAPQPSISGFNPVQGMAGTTVIISGANLAGVSTVLFNGVSATFTVLNAGTISATVPAGSGTGIISVFSTAGSANSGSSFTVLAPPNLVSFSPMSGPTGTLITISGTNFTGLTSVSVSGISAVFNIVSDNLVTATVPAGAVTGILRVTGPAGTSVGPAVFTVTAPPVISSFTPVQGPTGTRVTIIGANFGNVSAVMFGQEPALFTVLNQNTITATVPAGAVTATIKLYTTSDSGESANVFTVLDLPELTSLSPTQGPTGTLVTVTGNNFTGLTTVRLGGQSIGFNIVNNTSFTFTVPANATGGVLIVTGPVGSDTIAPGFAVFAQPAITDVSPGSGVPGNTIQLTGFNFTGTNSVKFGTVSAAFTVIDANTISVTVPAGAGTGLIYLTTPGGTAQSEDAFLILSPPVITGFTPYAVRSGDTVTISGNNLAGTLSVKINGLSAAFETGSFGTVRVEVPAGFGTGSIELTTGGGTATTSLWLTEVPFAWNYCTPAYSNAACNGNFIAGVGITGSSLAYSSAACAAKSANSYTLSPMAGSSSGTIVSGVNPVLNITTGTGTPIILACWLDINRNGQFEASEYRSISAGAAAGSTVSASLNLPASVTEGPVALRIRSRNIGSTVGSGESCSSFGSGQALDFILNVVQPHYPGITHITPDTGTPGSVIIIHGTNLGTTQSLSLNSQSLVFTVINDTTVSAFAPSNLGSGTVSLTNSFGQVNSSGTFTVLSAPALSLIPFAANYCSGDSIRLSFSASGWYPANNAFNVEASDNSGSFTNPVQLGSGTGQGSFIFRLPTSLTGNQFKVRVTSTQPALQSSDNGSFLTVYAKPVVSAGAAIAVCAGSNSVALTDASPAGGTWKGASLLPGNIFVPDNAGVFNLTYTYTNANGCRDSAVKQVTVLALPSTPAVSYSSSLNFCLGDSITLTAPSAFAQLWSTGEISRSITVKRSGSFALQTISSLGCTSQVSTAVLVTANPKPAQPVIDLLGSADLCEGDSVLLEAPDGYSTYLWNNNARTRRIWAKQTGGYSVLVTNASGCSDSSEPATVTFYSRAQPAVITASSALTFCTGDSVVLTASGGDNYRWSTGEITESIAVKASGNYYAIAYNRFGCPALPSALWSVTVNALPAKPVITRSVNTLLCSGDSVILSAPAGYAEYLWSTGEATPSIVVRESGNYNVKVKNASGCADSGTAMRIDINQSPAAPVLVNTGSSGFCQGDSVTLTATNGGPFYEWYNASGVLIIRNTSLVVHSAGTYTAKSLSANGCYSGISNALTVTTMARPTLPVITAIGGTTF
ncbi:MAG: IPT/TIG domain-containing protein, partial [Bacteroidota bacterium]